METVKRFRVDDPLHTGAHLVDDANGDAVLYADYAALESQYNEVKQALGKIEKQRAQWRASKSKSRRKDANPLRYDPAQTSIYGDGHVTELTT